MSSKIIFPIILIFLFLFFVNTVYADTDCPAKCEDGIYYSDGSYSSRSETCTYSTEEPCANGCNSRNTACEVLPADDSDTTSADADSSRSVSDTDDDSESADSADVPVTPSCSDSDDGLDYSVKGSISAIISDGTPVNASDNCKDEFTVHEFKCTGDYFGFVDYDCTEEGMICEDGACVVPPYSCSDSDGGLDYLVKGKMEAVLYNGDEIFGWDNCKSEFILHEFKCTGDFSGFVDYDCTEEGMICEDGACVVPPYECSDSDGGLDYSVKGKMEAVLYNGTEIFGWDNCKSPTLLHEFKCTGDFSGFVDYDCTEQGMVCDDGACVVSDTPIQPSPDPEPQPIPEDGSCLGCEIFNTCIPTSTRLTNSDEEPIYCNWDKQLLPQKAENSDCQNAYECLSNTCTNGHCADLEKQQQEATGLLEQIMQLIQSILSFLGLGG